MLAEGERFVYSPRRLLRLLQRTGMRRHGHAFGDIDAIYLTARLGGAAHHPAAVHARLGDGLSARRMTRVARCPNPAVRGAYGHRSPLPRLGQSNDLDTTYV